ncbi:iron-sulfur cluster assembly scaffold protein [Sphingomonas sanguinis]|jgi:NifU-like protein involved in Fe-S cluster formation|uniref:Iron-sulfur cluster assembly scaffold protein n=1 Tax=Sphingomonas sanguinis TaxID=33051 RepID=A0A7Y7UQD3_9SPHN|nr:iron-sulfur cluster assembly scaffold protein [Sphingomonas sanguinis]MBZ6381492.1 iron-sulfur cluster assembly scaffold protein [Sphingomonas sanguinis]NNG51133.1 iron-sulfur cluster assembly scaffold protein [Sphingomonas sanguinis]NNG52921.1 iron-sulfur cluster assembly scaffold protein [Sphingomonas sanguinis]NVP30794.1 iron-sulfur cluster assembly scaffold protein [Sphingomonas sanguinis]
MTAPLYNAEILRLTTAIPHDQRLTDPMASVEKRSPICGSRVTVDIDLDEDGRVSQVGMLVRACALGQASAALLSAHIVGRSVSELAEARDALTGWLEAEQGDAPDWPGLEVFSPALTYTARHPSIRLAFEAAAEAAEQASGAMVR